MVTTPAPPIRDVAPDVREMDVETLVKLYPTKMDPMPDSIWQLDHFLVILDVLKRFFALTGRVVTMMSDSFIYYRNELGETTHVAPDIAIVLDVNPDDIKDDRSYFVERAGKPPDFVMEIGSHSTADRDLYEKPRIYAHIGVRQYWLFDPEGGANYGFPLMGLRLVNGVYEPIEMTNLPNGAVSGYSDVLGLTILWDGDELRFIDPLSGSPLRTSAELEADERAARREASEGRRRLEAVQAELDELRRMLGER